MDFELEGLHNEFGDAIHCARWFDGFKIRKSYPRLQEACADRDVQQHVA